MCCPIFIDMSDLKLELLSPAGDLEIFKSVINAGADAVYFGGDLFGARAFAKNFSKEEGAEAIRYAHLHGKMAYLTVNTLLKNLEMEKELFSYIRHYYEQGIDAVIVQDMGVFSFLRQMFPDLAIHASTQMTIGNAYGAKMLKELGATRVVTSREISLAEIKNIYDQTQMEIETFVHGALCVSYSGNCLMSSMLGGRSGNRGRCAQPCRLPYQLYDSKGQKRQMPGEYLLSPKDLCGIEDIPSMAEAGVFSFKIEGRMKQLSYATGVVSMYRKYMDAYLEGRDTALTDSDRKILMDLGNRCGFTNAYYYKQNDADMITYKNPSHEKSQRVYESAEEKDIPIVGCVTAKVGQPLTVSVKTEDGYQVTIENGIVESAINNPTTHETVENKMKKTGNTPFCFKDLSITIDSDAFLPIAAINAARREVLEQLQCQMEQRYPKREHANVAFVALEETKNKPTEKASLTVVCSTIEQFAVACLDDFVTTVAVKLETLMQSDVNGDQQNTLEEHFLSFLRMAKENKKQFFVMLPLVFRKRTSDFLEGDIAWLHHEELDGVIACSYDTLGFLDELGIPKDKVCLDHRVYSFNNRSVQAFADMGYMNSHAPLELNHKELSHRNNEHSQFLIYGRVLLMVSANCTQNNCEGCSHRPSIYYLQDRYKERFPVKNVCAFCYNEVYNSKIYHVMDEADTIQKLGFAGYRIDFSFESKEEVKEVLATYGKHFLLSINDKKRAESSDIFTKGHFKRGVE